MVSDGVVIDIEGDNLTDLVKTIHVVCWRSLYDPSLCGSFRDHGDFKRWLWKEKPRKVVTHHGLGYDHPVLRKVWGIPYSVGKVDTFGEIETEIIDTFQLSSFLFPDRPGGHGLLNLSKLAGGPVKMEYDGGFEEYTPEMEEYCLGDTASDVSVYHYLMREVQQKYDV
jgi:hypothetical protein